MTIGEKIKKLRTDKLMSQSELAGSEITRNMLSQIEHDTATPSLQTVRYIASRLNVSVAFLLADEADEAIFVKHTKINDIKKAYRAGSFELCYDMCKNCEWRDDEITLIFAECCLRVGCEYFSKGSLHLAAELFDEAFEACNKTIYNTDAIYFETRAYFSYMALISPTLSSGVDDGREPEGMLVSNDSFAIYSDIMSDAEKYGWDNVPRLGERSGKLSPESSYALHIGARMMIWRKDFERARFLLRKLLYADSYGLAEPIMYFVFCDMEICCKETGDFKGAYEHSTNKMTLLQKLLA